MSESVHVQRTASLPDSEGAAIVFHHDESIIIYMNEDDITPAGALALEAILTEGRAEYHRQWGLPLVVPIAA